MHFYGKDGRSDKFIHVFLAVLAGAIIYVASFFANRLYPNLISPFSFFIVFALLEVFFERFGWRIIPHLPGNAVRNLRGVWKGELAVGAKKVVYPATISIKQEWSRILIVFESSDAEGKSFSASFFFDRIGDKRFELAYNYYAKSKDSADRNYFDHYGTAILYLDEESDILKGEYFTEKSRNSFGKMEFRRQT